MIYYYSVKHKINEKVDDGLFPKKEVVIEIL
jgi:hypothetical protein